MEFDTNYNKNKKMLSDRVTPVATATVLIPFITIETARVMA